MTARSCKFMAMDELCCHLSLDNVQMLSRRPHIPLMVFPCMSKIYLTPIRSAISGISRRIHDYTYLEQKKAKIMYSTRCSLVVTDPTTNLALKWLSIGDRTGSRFVTRLWPYMLGYCFITNMNQESKHACSPAIELTIHACWSWKRSLEDAHLPQKSKIILLALASPLCRACISVSIAVEQTTFQCLYLVRRTTGPTDSC